jgi:sirohydrochlorin ferrochelatase
MNETFREVKDRMRRLDVVLERGGSSNVEFAQAVSRVRRLVKKGDRSREPSQEIRVTLDRAEAMGRLLVSG